MRKNVISVLCDRRNEKIIEQTTKYALNEIKKEADSDLLELIKTVEGNLNGISVEIKQLILIYLINQEGQVQTSILRNSSEEFKEHLLFGLNKLCTAFAEKRIAPKKVIRGTRKLNKYVCKSIAHQ